MRQIAKNKQNFNKFGEKLQKMCQKLNVFSIDISFLLVFVFAFFLGELRLYIFYIVSLLCHEFCHLLMAKHLGYFPRKIKLNFFGAALEGNDDFLSRDEIKIVLAGPLFNVFVIIFCYLCFWFEPETYIYLYDLLISNLAIFLFNFLPIFPLDFGRILLLLFSIKKDRFSAINITKIISIIFISFIFFVGIIFFFYSFNWSLALSSINLMSLSLTNCEDTSFKRQVFVARKFKLLKKGLLEKVVYINHDTPLYSLFKFIDDSHYFQFVFLNSNFEVEKILTETEFYKQLKMI